MSNDIDPAETGALETNQMRSDEWGREYDQIQPTVADAIDNKGELLAAASEEQQVAGYRHHQDRVATTAEPAATPDEEYRSMTLAQEERVKAREWELDKMNAEAQAAREGERHVDQFEYDRARTTRDELADSERRIKFQHGSPQTTYQWMDADWFGYAAVVRQDPLAGWDNYGMLMNTDYYEWWGFEAVRGQQNPATDYWEREDGLLAGPHPTNVVITRDRRLSHADGRHPVPVEQKHSVCYRIDREAGREFGTSNSPISDNPWEHVSGSEADGILNVADTLVDRWGDRVATNTATIQDDLARYVALGFDLWDSWDSAANRVEAGITKTMTGPVPLDFVHPYLNHRATVEVTITQLFDDPADNQYQAGMVRDDDGAIGKVVMWQKSKLARGSSFDMSDHVWRPIFSEGDRILLKGAITDRYYDNAADEERISLAIDGKTEVRILNHGGGDSPTSAARRSDDPSNPVWSRESSDPAWSTPSFKQRRFGD